MGSLIIRIAFWVPLYDSYFKEPPEYFIGNYLGPYSKPSTRNLRTFCPALAERLHAGLGSTVLGFRVLEFRVDNFFVLCHECESLGDAA